MMPRKECFHLYRFFKQPKGHTAFTPCVPFCQYIRILILRVPLFHHFPLHPKPLCCARPSAVPINPLHILNNFLPILLIYEIRSVPNGPLPLTCTINEPIPKQEWLLPLQLRNVTGLEAQGKLPLSVMFFYACIDFDDFSMPTYLGNRQSRSGKKYFILTHAGSQE